MHHNCGENTQHIAKKIKQKWLFALVSLVYCRNFCHNKLFYDLSYNNAYSKNIIMNLFDKTTKDFYFTPFTRTHLCNVQWYLVYQPASKFKVLDLTTGRQHVSQIHKLDVIWPVCGLKINMSHTLAI